jgi:hypothetical protein
MSTGLVNAAVDAWYYGREQETPSLAALSYRLNPAAGDEA